MCVCMCVCYYSVLQLYSSFFLQATKRHVALTCDQSSTECRSTCICLLPALHACLCVCVRVCACFITTESHDWFGHVQQEQHQVQYHVPDALNLAGESSKELGEQVAIQGLMALPHMAEIYPVGGKLLLLLLLLRCVCISVCLCTCLFIAEIYLVGGTLLLLRCVCICVYICVFAYVSVYGGDLPGGGYAVAAAAAAAAAALCVSVCISFCLCMCLFMAEIYPVGGTLLLLLLLLLLQHSVCICVFVYVCVRGGEIYPVGCVLLPLLLLLLLLQHRVCICVCTCVCVCSLVPDAAVPCAFHMPQKATSG